jgi:hypothetical protein
MTDGNAINGLRRLRRKRRLTTAILLLAAVGMLPRPAFPGSSTAQLGVSLTIVAGCGVSGRPLGAGAQSIASGPTARQVAVNVSCDNAVPYRVETYRAVIVDTGSNGVNIMVIY